MPIYRYNCHSCGTEFDKLVMSSSRRDDVQCAHCKSEQTERQLSAPNVCCQVESSVPAGCANPSGFT